MARQFIVAPGVYVSSNSRRQDIVAPGVYLNENEISVGWWVQFATFNNATAKKTLKTSVEVFATFPSGAAPAAPAAMAFDVAESVKRSIRPPQPFGDLPFSVPFRAQAWTAVNDRTAPLKPEYQIFDGEVPGGNVPTQFIGNAWVVFPDRFIRPGTARLLQYDWAYLASPTVIVTYPEGWRGDSPRAALRRASVAAQFDVIGKFPEVAVQEGWRLDSPQVVRGRRPAPQFDVLSKYAEAVYLGWAWFDAAPRARRGFTAGDVLTPLSARALETWAIAYFEAPRAKRRVVQGDATIFNILQTVIPTIISGWSCDLSWHIIRQITPPMMALGPVARIGADFVTRPLLRGTDGPPQIEGKVGD